MYKSLILIAFLTVSLLLSTTALANNAEEIAAIKQALVELSERLAALEAGRDSAPRKSAPAAAPGWPDRIQLKGDLRYRHEGIDEDTKEERTRQRIRARVGLVATVSDSAEVGVQIASGSDDPTSTNQTLDGGASTKGVGLDLAYFSIKPAAGNKITGGKMKKPWYLPGKSSLIWDGDLNPEGVAWQYSGDGFFANVSGQWIDERSANADAIMVGAQAGLRTKLANGSKLTAGAGYYDYGATKGNTPFFDGDGHGNTLDANGNYANDFEILEFFAELGTRLGEMPFSIYADWVRNGAVNSMDSGSLFGAKLGKASAPASWELGYSYRDLEADAVVGVFSDSDIGGGGTAISGHIIDFGYAFDKRIKAKLTYFVSENRSGTAAERDYNRIQADLSLKY